MFLMLFERYLLIFCSLQQPWFLIISRCVVVGILVASSVHVEVTPISSVVSIILLLAVRTSLLKSVFDAATNCSDKVAHFCE